MDLNAYAIGIDTYEGSLDIDEPLLKSSGVEYIFIRMNDTAGGLHGDANYANEWGQSGGFCRAPYYVVSPYVNASYQAQYILDHMLDGCSLVSLDVELKPGYGATKASYSALVKGIIKTLKGKGVRPIIYTGAWFLEYLSPWPTDVEYWWAAYPSIVYPDKSVTLSWDAAKQLLACLEWLKPVAPANIAIWQCTGDRWKLPGCAGRAMDVNLMPRENLNSLWGPAPEPRKWYTFLTMLWNK